jgi:zinc protease
VKKLIIALLCAATACAQSYKDLKYPPMGAVKIPTIAQVTLPNGIRLYLLENHNIPLVRGLALVRTGNLFDPRDKIGLATMTGMVLRTGGTASRTGDQLDEQLENIAASVETSIGESMGTVSFSCLTDNTDEVLATVRDVMTNPAFRQEKIDLAKNELRSGIARRNDDAQAIASREFTSLLYGKDTPYGWDMQYATVDNIQRADLQQFYSRYFFPGNIMFAVQGDFSAPAMQAKLEKLFAGWNVKQPAVPAFPQVTAQTTPGTYLVTKTDVTQTTFYLGQRGGLLSDKDYPALEVMSDILGGGFQSRLFRRVRTQLGYAYGINADWGAHFDHPGLFTVEGSTKSASSTEAIKAASEEIDRMRTGQVTGDELDLAKNTVLNSFVFLFDTPAKTLNRLLTYEYFGYPKDFIFKYQKAIEAVTKSDITRVANQYLDPKQLTIVAVGNPAEFGAKLDTLGRPVTPLDITIPEPKTEVAAGDQASLDAGKRMLQELQQKSGGAEKLAAIHDVSQQISMQVNAPTGAMKVKQNETWLLPTAFRQETIMPMGSFTVYFDGATGFIASPQGTIPISPVEQQQMRDELFRIYPTLLLSDRIAGRVVNRLADGTLQISDGHDNVVRLTLNPQTGLLAKVAYQQADPRGPAAQMEQIYEAYSTAGAVQFPQKVTVLRNGQKYADLVVDQIRINTGVSAAELSRKP